ncbi:AT hook domain-containing protein [Colletotrichum falcatum]|nr:AT hook domain-containing protein [Colletotrichum falcatum]
MTTRAERMQQRMRGAGHGQVEDVSFQLDFGDDLTATGIELQSSPERPIPRTTPNTSAKRRKLETDAPRLPAIPATNDTSLTSRQPSGKDDPYELQEGSSTESARFSATQTAKSPTAVVEHHDAEPVDSLPPPRPAAPAPPVSPVSRRGTGEHVEVEESPVDAPGSGRRRTITTSSALVSSVRLQQALSPGDNETETVPISSPLERKVRRNTAGTRSSRGSRTSAASADDGPDDTSPDQTGRSLRKRISPELSYSHDAEPEEPTAPVSELVSPSELQPEPETIVEEVREVEQDHDDSLAGEVNTDEAAQRLGRKRPRRSPKPPSPEPDSTIADEDHDEPLPKRRKRQTQKSPAKQKQGRPKGSSKAKDTSPKVAPKRKKKKQQQQGSDEARESVTIPVQRFTKRVPVAEGDEDEADVLNLDIPFAGRSGVNTVDVLTQVCDEMIETSLDALKEGVRNAQDKAAKREYQVQFRALEAYREELQTRLLQHTILLDALHSLRKRVRSVQKERMALRDEIMRIRAERDQVALRKDAVRIKHEKVTEEALNQLSLSSQMHDIDLAVDRGRAAPELGPAEKKTAELANLEILISRITDQACSQSGAGGTLKQIRDFNALLERAAVALEGR